MRLMEETNLNETFFVGIVLSEDTQAEQEDTKENEKKRGDTRLVEN